MIPKKLNKFRETGNPFYLEEISRGQAPLETFVLIKQVPDPNSKTGVNSDGTIDRAKAKRMLNPLIAMPWKRLYKPNASTGPG